MWFSVAPTMDTKNTCSKKTSQNMITILGSRVNKIGGGGGLYEQRLFNEHENLHFDNEEGILNSSKHYEESGHDHDLDC